MSIKGEATREKIISAAEALVLDRGYAGTSLDDLLKVTGLTKGAFFHHFKCKADLSRAIIERYAEADLGDFRAWSERADRLSDDPLERVLIFLKLIEESFQQIEGDTPPRCMFAAYLQQPSAFPQEIHAFIRDSLKQWQAIYERKFAALIAARPPAQPVTAQALAELVTAVLQGGMILGSAFHDRDYALRQSRQVRQYLELLFRPAAAPH